MRDKEKVSEYNRAYREKNKDKIRKLQKDYYDNHRSERIKNARNWAIRNPDVSKQTRRAYMSTPTGRLTSIKSSAKTRKIEFGLSDTDALLMLENTCYYCGACDRISIDRADSEIGYYIENCVPCCAMCNIMKNVFSHTDFVEQCKRISKHLT